MDEAKALLKIIKSFLDETECVVSEKIDEEKLYDLAKRNKVSNFLQNWATLNCKSEKIKKLILADYNRQIIKDTNENIELEQILNQFEENEIRTLVVKGILMKEIYPQNYMRQMCDMDIMTDERDFKIALKIMKKLGYKECYNHEKHLIFKKLPFIIVELHRKLMTKRDIGYEYFENVWSNCCQYKDYKNIFQLDLDEAYIFCILHLMLHFKFAGIQVRDMLDVYLYHEKYKQCLHYEKINQVLGELKVLKFEKNLKEIAYKWFDNEEIEDFSEIEKIIFKGWSIENNIHYAVGENHGKSNYILRLFFPEFKIMKEKYPILKKAPVLLPITWVARILKDIFSKETTVKARLNKIKLIQEVEQEDVTEIQNIYQKLGIIRKED